MSDNPWRETVRDLYDLAAFAAPQDKWIARKVLRMIEERHPDDFARTHPLMPEKRVLSAEAEQVIAAGHRIAKQYGAEFVVDPKKLAAFEAAPRPFTDTVRERMERDPEFREAMREADPAARVHPNSDQTP